MNELLDENWLLEGIQNIVSMWMGDNGISDIENLDIRINACNGRVNYPEIISESHKII